MKKNEIFTFTAHNGVKVTAIAVNELSSDYRELTDTIVKTWICYSQNRLFYYFEEIGRKNVYTPEEEVFIVKAWDGGIIVDYAILPDYDTMLETASMEDEEATASTKKAETA